MWWNKDKEPKQPKLSKHEIAKAKKPENVQRLIEMYPYAWHLNEEDECYCWVKIIKDRPEAMAKTIDLSRANLDKIIKDLDTSSSCVRTGWSGNRLSNDKYRLNDVQGLVDYSISLRHAMSWLMKESIERGIAEYDSEGKFHIKGEDENTVG